MGLCQDWHILLLLPGMTAALGLAYAHGWACRRGSGAGGTRGGATGRQGQTEESGAPGHLAQRGVSAGGPPGGRTHTRCAGGRFRPPVQAARHPGLGPVAPGREHGAPGVARARARFRPLPPGPRPGRGTGDAPAPGTLPPTASGTLYARQGLHEQARAALSTAIELYRIMAMTRWLPQAEIILAQVA